MGKTKMMLFAVLAVLVLAVAAFTLTNNEGLLDTIISGDNNEGTDNTTMGEDNEIPSNNDTTVEGSIVGNWTFVSGIQNGEPVTHIASGWLHYKADGTWRYSYDYGYTILDDEGTWQAQRTAFRSEV